MGFWGTSLYSNDTTNDVRDTYKSYLEKQCTNLEAFEKTLEQCHEYIGIEEEPFFWYALAETQWKVGRLMPEVKLKAIEWIEKEGGISLWDENKKGVEGWKKTLEKLRITLETDQPKEKKFRKHFIPFQNPWKLNDIYAYKINKWNITKEQKDVYGKYFLIQKIGEEQSSFSKDTVMIVQIYDKLFDILPSLNEVKDNIKYYRVLPAYHPNNQEERYIRNLQGKPDPGNSFSKICFYEPILMSEKMEQYHKNPSYPENNLFFICNAEGIVNKQHLRKNNINHNFVLRSQMWHNFEDGIGKRFAVWQGINYDIIGEGTFEYPTLEQQRKIKSKLN